MPLIVQLGQSQQQFGQARVADTSAADTARAQQKQQAIADFTGAIATGVSGFAAGASNRVNTQGVQDAIRGQKNEYIQDSKLLSGLYTQSYNQTSAQQKVAQFQDSIPALYEQGAAQGLEPSKVQANIVEQANKLDGELQGLELDDAFKLGLSKAVAASYNSIYKIGTEIQAGQAVSNAQAGLNSFIGSTVSSLNYSLEAGDSGGARAQLGAAVQQIQASQWLKPEQKQQQIQNLYLQAAAGANSPNAVQFLQQEAEAQDPANVGLRSRFKDLQAQAGGQVRADLITAQSNYSLNPSTAGAAELSSSVERARALGVLTPEQAASQQAEIAQRLQPVRQQEQFMSLLRNNDITVRTAAIQSGLDPDQQVKKITDGVVDVGSGVRLMGNATANHDPDLYAESAKATARVLNPILSVLSTFKQGDEVTPAISQALDQFNALGANRAAVVANLPQETQALLLFMEDRGGINAQTFAAAQADAQTTKKFKTLPGSDKRKTEALEKSVSNLNTRIYNPLGGTSGLVREDGNVGRIMGVLKQELDGVSDEEWNAAGTKSVEIRGATRVRTVAVQEPGFNANRAFAVTSVKGTTIDDVSKTLGVGAYFDQFAAGEVQRLKAAYPKTTFSRFEFQADGSISASAINEDTGQVSNFNVSAQDIRDRVSTFQKDTNAAQENFYYRTASVKPHAYSSDAEPVLVSGNSVTSSGITADAATVTNTAIAIFGSEGYRDAPYKDGATARTVGFGTSTAGGFDVDTKRTPQQHADIAVHGIETKYLPKALASMKAAGIDYAEDRSTLLATDIAYQGGSPTPILKAMAAGDKAGAIAALKATKAYELAGKDRNAKRIAWIEAGINNLQGRRNAQAIRGNVSNISKY